MPWTEKINRAANIFALLFVTSLCVYGWMRASHEYRWSYWAAGDAQDLNGAIHFRDEGYIQNNFLMFPSPGLVNYFIPNNWPNGRYSHIPSLHTLINGLYLKIFSDPLYPPRYAAVFFASLALLLWHFIYRRIFNPAIACLAVFYMGISLVHLDFMDALTNYPYDSFLRAASILLILWIAGNETAEKWKRNAAYASLWALLFIGASNSIEYIIYLEVFIVGFLWAARKKFPLFEAVLFGLAPVGALAFNFWNACREWGGFQEALADWTSILGDRVSGATEASQNYGNMLAALAQNLAGYYWHYYKFAFAVGSAFFILRFALKRRAEQPFFNREQSIFFWLLFACGIIFWWMLPNQSIRMISYNTAQLAPFFTLLLALATYEIVRTVSTWELGKFKNALAIAAFLGTTALVAYPSIEYIKHYPNLMDRKLWGINAFTLEEWQRRVWISQWLKANTEWGDIVIISNTHFVFTTFEGNPVDEFYAQRKLIPIGLNVESLQQRVSLTRDYKQKYALKDPRIPHIKTYIALDAEKTRQEFLDYCAARFKLVKNEAGVYLYLAH